MNFNSFAKKYDRYNRMHFGKGYESFRDLTVFKGDFDNYGTILEFGCGTSLGLEHIIGKFDFKGNYIGVDIAKGMLDVARNKFTEDRNILHIQISPDGKLPVTENSVDAIFSSLVFHLIPIQTRDLIFSEFVRILKPGGSVFLNEFGAPSNFRGQLFKMYIKYFWSFIVKEEKNARELLDGKFILELQKHFNKVEFLEKTSGIIDHIHACIVKY